MSAQFYEEYKQKLMMERGLVETPSLPGEVGTLRESELTMDPNTDPAASTEVIPAMQVNASPEMAMEIRNDKNKYWGNAADDGILMSVAKGIFNGMAKAGHALNDIVVEGANLPIQGYEKLTGRSVDFRFKKISESGGLDLAATDTLGEVTTGLTQFGIGFVSGGNVLRAAGWARSGKKLADAGRAIVQGSFADFAAFRGEEERLSNVLTQVDSPILNNAVTQYLAADDNDGVWEGRLKNVLEGGILGVAGDAIVPAIRGIKKAKKALLDGKPEVANEIMQAARQETAQILDSKQALIAEETKNIDDNFDFFAKLDVDVKGRVINETAWSENAVKEVAERVRAFKDAPPEQQLDNAQRLLAGKIRVDKLNTEQEVYATMDAMAEVTLPKFDSWSHAKQLESAQARGLDLPTLQRYYKEGVVNENALLSSEILLREQAAKVTDLISKNVSNNQISVEVNRYQELLNMFSSFKNISGRTLGANRIQLELRRGNVEEAQKFLTDRFGSEKNFEKFKEAWIATGGNLGEIAQLNKIPVHKIIADSALEFWKNGLLSGFKTMTVNMVGNQMNLYKEIGQRWFSGLNGAARASMVGIEAGQERVYMGEALAMTMAQVDSFMETVVAASRVVRNPSYLKSFNVPRNGGGDKAELGYVRKISADYWGIGTQPGALARYVERMLGVPGMQTQAAMRFAVDKAGGIVNTPGNLLNIMDNMSQSQARRSQKYALAYRKLMSEGSSPTEALSRMKSIMDNPGFEDSITESLEDFARRATFQTELGPNGLRVQQLIKGFRPLSVPVLEYVVPFIRAPINIFNQGVTEVNPMIAPLSRDFREGIKAGGVQADEVMGRLAFGTSLATTATLLATNGVITGAGPNDPDMRQSLMRSGWRPYSIRIDNGVDANGNQQYKYVGYNRLEPAAWLIGSMATAVETSHYAGLINERKEADFKDYASAVMSAMTEATMDKSFFQGAVGFVQTLADPQRYLQGTINQYAGSMVPAISRDIEILLQNTPYLRDVRSAEDAINNRLIGQSGEVAVTRNRWGDPIAMDEGWFLGARSYFSPIGMSDKYSEPIDLEIKRLAIDGVQGPDGEVVNFPSAMLNLPSRTIVRRGMSIRLDPHQYSRLLQIAGKEIKLDPLGLNKPMTMKEALNHLVTKEDVYRESPPIRQARLIKQVSKGYDELARDQLFMEYPELQKKLERGEQLDIMSKTGVATPEDQFKLLEDLNGGS